MIGADIANAASSMAVGPSKRASITKRRNTIIWCPHVSTRIHRVPFVIFLPIEFMPFKPTRSRDPQPGGRRLFRPNERPVEAVPGEVGSEPRE